MKLGTIGRLVGNRTRAGVSATLVNSFFGRRPWIHGQHTRMLPPMSMEPWAAIKKLYTSVEVTPAPVRIPTQRPHLPNFTSVVGLARTFHLAPVYKAVGLPTSLYGSETWIVLDKRNGRVKSSDMKYSTRLDGKTTKQ